MTTLPAEPGFTPPAHLIGAWMSRQRWYANRGSLPDLEQIGSWLFPSAPPGVVIATFLLLDHTAGKPALYQVPLTFRTVALPDSTALVCTLDGLFAYDAPHDPAYTGALLELITDQRELVGDRLWIRGRRAEGGVAGLIEPRVMQSRVLTGEQSNTSIVFESADGIAIPVICKLFRAVHDGENPDVVLQSALAEAGSAAVPRPVGHVIAEWDDSGQATGRALGHLACAQEFLRGATDGWRVALAAAGELHAFDAEARALGRATAEVHEMLAATMPTRPTSAIDVDAIIAQMNGRLTAAIAEVADLANYADAITAVFERARTARWPDQQRIHGDLHLGQVLAVPARGWVLVDFEGEPLRPMRERGRLDNPMRDVAGMLRSFDYVAGSRSVGNSPETAADESAVAGLSSWVAEARAAFEEGYSAASATDLAANRAIVDAFEIDKALYETVYEARNRPDWLAIPVGAIGRLVRRATKGG